MKDLIHGFIITCFILMLAFLFYYLFFSSVEQTEVYLRCY